jgi:hypothetical protein
MDKRVLNAAAVAAALVLLTACSDAPKTPDASTKPVAETKEPAKPAEPVAGKTAFWEMYKPARTWATDVQPLTLASNEVKSLPSVDGKFGMWTAVFVSPSRREARTCFFSVVEHDNILRGVNCGGAQVWSGATPKSQPFTTADFAVNSDEAYKVAFEKAEDWVKKHPGKKPAFFLANSSRFPAPAWYVVWGDSKVGYNAFVNATTGKLMTGK